jgi:ParB family chromosome partitioning protein
MEIDENLIRAELSELERSEHLRERKIVYEALHPETRKGGDRKSAKAQEQNQNAETAVRSFIADAAEKTGDAKRTIQVAVRRAEKIAPEVRAAIRDGGIAHRGVDLDALTRLTPEDQAAAVERVRAGTAKDLRAGR